MLVWWSDFFVQMTKMRYCVCVNGRMCLFVCGLALTHFAVKVAPFTALTLSLGAR